jgi:DNA-binding IclR family transcriptional regulator
MAELIERVRHRGYAVSVGETMAETFDKIVGSPSAQQSDLSNLWSSLSRDYAALAVAEDWQQNVASIQVPVFAADGTTYLELYIAGFDSVMTPDVFERVVACALSTAGELTQLVGGEYPADYPLSHPIKTAIGL